MEQEALYTIGQVSKICDVSQRMLRYYEKVGLITPDHIAKPSHYRYYSVRTMQRVQVIRYLIDQGFRLEEISEALSGEDMDRFEALFLQKIDQTRSEIEYYHQRLDSLWAWYGLLVEGRAAQRHQNRAITMKYIPEERYFYYTRQRAPEEQDSEIRLEIEYFTMSKRDGHSMVDMGGAFHVKYDSVAERMEDRYCSMTLLQTMFPNSKSQNNTAHFGGFLAVAGYHLGGRGMCATATSACCCGRSSTVSPCGATVTSAMCWMCIPRRGRKILSRNCCCRCRRIRRALNGWNVGSGSPERISGKQESLTLCQTFLFFPDLWTGWVKSFQWKTGKRTK